MNDTILWYGASQEFIRELNQIGIFYERKGRDNARAR